MKHKSKIPLKAIFVFLAFFVLLSSLLLQASAESEIILGTIHDNGSILITPHSLVGSSSGTSLQPMVTETGKINLSVDGLGTSGSGIIQVEKPEDATVRSAYLLVTGEWTSTVPNGSVLIDENAVYWDTSVDATCHNYWTDVTSIVESKIDAAPAGRINFTITEQYPASTDGSALVVIFDDPSQKVDNTVVLTFGAQNTTGDTFNVKLAEPLDKSDPDLAIDMGLAISFSYQNGGTDQSSQVEVNGERVTSSAGGEDDGSSTNGELITVGGLDDSNENPSDPFAAPSNPRTDDELYNLLPFVDNGTTNITVYTCNPSNDDNIFFSYFFLKSTTAMVGEGILLSPASGNASAGFQYTLSSVLQDDDGNPLSGKEVNFSVISGPNAGKSGNVTTDETGTANFSYSGTSEGTDLIEASFVNSEGETITSNQASVEWMVPPSLPPVANFDSNVTGGVQPLTVSFYDLSENAVSWDWDFGDGNSSELQNCTHTYFDPGYYTVSLSVNNSTGGSNMSVREDYLFVQARPVPAFSSNVTVGTFPLTVQFMDNSSYSESLEWNFGDGNSSSERNPVHTYTNSGLYTVTLTTIGNNTSVTKTIDDFITVTIPPVPAFSTNITKGLYPLAVQFTDNSSYAESVEWDFGDGNTSTDRNPVHIYSEAGLYTVSLAATGNGTSVTKTVDDYINVTLSPIPDFGANVTNGPYPLTVLFTDNSSYAESVEWDFGDGSTSSERNPVHTYEARGLYTVTLAASGNGTTVNKTVGAFINVTIQPFPPTANFSTNLVRGPVPLTVNFTDESYNAVTWRWDVDGDGQIDYTEKNPVHTYDTPGSYNVSLYVSNAYGNDTKVVEGCINVLAHPVISERTLSKISVYPGEEFTANLSIESAWDLQNLTVVEDIPAGWTITPIDSAGAEFYSSSNTWVWENFSSGDSRQLVYTLKAPLDSDFGLFKLEGNVSAKDVIAIPIEGESEITVTPIADYNPKNLKLLHVSDSDQEFNISTHMPCNFTWYVNGEESTEGNAENSSSASLILSPEALWGDENFTNNYTSVENSSLFAGKYSVIGSVSKGSAAINQTWNFLITDSAESKNNINNTVVLPVREVEANESVTFNFTEDSDNTDDNSILGLSFNASSAGNVSVFVEVLKDRSSEVSEDPEGGVYQYINIHISNQTVVNETGSDSKFIDFKVSKAWVETVVQGTVRLNRYHNGEWQSLNTWEIGSDSEYCYFRAETPGFSPFSITADAIPTSSSSSLHSGGGGTGSATIISSDDTSGSISGTESVSIGSTQSEEPENILGSDESDSGKSVSIEDGNDSNAPEENSGSGQSSRVGVILFILFVFLVVVAYLVYRQSKEEK